MTAPARMAGRRCRIKSKNGLVVFKAFTPLAGNIAKQAQVGNLCIHQDGNASPRYTVQIAEDRGFGPLVRDIEG